MRMLGWAMVLLALALFCVSCANPKTETPVSTGAVIDAPVEGDISDDDTTNVETKVDNENTSNSTWLLLGQDIISHSFWLVIALVAIIGLWKGKWDKFGG